jgi:hypothetical protein
MAGRTVYACTTCQPLLPDTGPLPAARAKAVAGAAASREFVSHCAAEVRVVCAREREWVFVCGRESERGCVCVYCAGYESCMTLCPAPPKKHPHLPLSLTQHTHHHHHNTHTTPPKQDAASKTPAKMTIAELSAALATHGLPTAGRKPLLVARLTEALAAKQQQLEQEEEETGRKEEPSLLPPPATPDAMTSLLTTTRRPRRRSSSSSSEATTAASSAAPAAAAAASSSSSSMVAAAIEAEVSVVVSSEVNMNVNVNVKPGTAHLGREGPASAASAAREKRAAGENRAVEHVALHDAEELGEVLGEVGGRPKRRRVMAGAGAAGGAAAVAGGKMNKSGTSKGASGRREWAAEVAVPGSAGLIDEVLGAAAAVKANAGVEE